MALDRVRLAWEEAAAAETLDSTPPREDDEEDEDDCKRRCDMELRVPLRTLCGGRGSGDKRWWRERGQQ